VNFEAGHSDKLEYSPLFFFFFSFFSFSRSFFPFPPLEVQSGCQCRTKRCVHQTSVQRRASPSVFPPLLCSFFLLPSLSSCVRLCACWKKRPVPGKMCVETDPKNASLPPFFFSFPFFHMSSFFLTSTDRRGRKVEVETSWGKQRGRLGSSVFPPFFFFFPYPCPPF